MGDLAVGKIVGWAIGLMVIAIILYILFTNIFNFDALFLSNDQRILKQYATCVLSYCAAGAGSDEVNAVGCLKYESGKCVLSCAQVQTEIYDKNGVKETVKEIGGRFASHYCGPDARLEFEFSGVSLGGVVPLASGQMDKLATSPQWVCKPIKIPFTDIEIPGTAGVQHAGLLGPQNCIILSGDKDPIFPGRAGCFLPIKYDKSYDSIYYTPIIEFDSPAQVIYPSAIYVDSSFTVTLPGASRPECDYRNPPNHRPVSDQEITDRINNLLNQPVGKKVISELGTGKPLSTTYKEYYDSLTTDEERQKFAENIVENAIGDISSSDNNLIGNVLNGCDFKTTYKEEKIKYSVWAKPVYPSVDALKDFAKIGDLQNFIAGLLGAASPELRIAFSYITAAGEGGTKLIFSQLGGSCTAVVLGRDLKEDSLLTQSASENEQTGVILEIITDKIVYFAGETVKVAGKVKVVEGSKFEVEMKRADVRIPIPVKTALEDDGSFSFEYKIPEGTKGVSGNARFEITVTYGADEKKISFEVS